MTIALIVRWTARILGTLMLLFVLYFVLTNVIASAETVLEFRDTKELVSFICFPVMPIIGLTVAWKWEGPGGLIVLLSIILFVILRPNLVDNPLIAILVLPGVLYIYSWHLARRRDRRIWDQLKTHQKMIKRDD